jgi:hypothetical protein
MNVSRQDSLPYIRVLNQMVPISLATILRCMIFEFTESIPVGVAANMPAL